MAIIFIGQLLCSSLYGDYFSTRRKGVQFSSEILNACMSYQKKVIHGKKSVILHYAIIQSEMGLFLSFSVLELQRGYLYLNGVEFLQKVIGAGLFWGHLNYSSGGLQTFPLLSVT